LKQKILSEQQTFYNREIEIETTEATVKKSCETKNTQSENEELSEENE